MNKILNGTGYLYINEHYEYCWLVSNNYFDDTIFLNDTVEIIEEQEEIDIQSIEDIKDIYIENASCGEDVKYLAKKYNEILKAVKQLDNK
jgi:hypothetical protein